MDAHEAAQMHQNFSQQLLQDHIEACSLPEHNLITVRIVVVQLRAVLGQNNVLCFPFPFLLLTALLRKLPKFGLLLYI